MKKQLKNTKAVKALDPRLIDLAAITPKNWGEEILERNTLLLEKLNSIVPYVGQVLGTNQGKNISWNKIIPYGCPHCKKADSKCENCIWKESDSGVKSYHCLNIPFYGVTYQDLLDKSSIYVSYSCRKASLNTFWPSELTEEDINKVRDFLEGHIAWAKLIMEIGLGYIPEPKRIV